MRFKVKFSLKDEFERFCNDYDGKLDIALKNEKRLTVAINGLTGKDITDIRRGYKASISTDVQSDPENTIC